MGWFSKASKKIKSGFSKVKNSVGNSWNNFDFKGTLFGGLLGGPIGMQYGSQYDMIRMQNEMQNEQIERQNELNMQMWNMQNEYNSPIAQMQRYEDAGLNSNLIYGSVSSGNASSAPEMTATGGSGSALALASVINQATGDANKFMKGIASKMLGNIIEDMDLNLMQKEANIQNTKAQTKQVLKSVETQAPKAPKTGRYGELYNLGKEVGNDLIDVADIVYRSLPVGMNKGEKKVSDWAEMKFLRGEWSKEKYFGFLKRQINNTNDSYYKILWKKYERY